MGAGEALSVAGALGGCHEVSLLECLEVHQGEYCLRRNVFFPWFPRLVYLSLYSVGIPRYNLIGYLFLFSDL